MSLSHYQQIAYHNGVGRLSSCPAEVWFFTHLVISQEILTCLILRIEIYLVLASPVKLFFNLPA